MIGADLAFALAIALAAASLTVPSAFQPPARALVERSPLPSALEEADALADALAALPGELIETALAPFGYGGEAPEPNTQSEDPPVKPGPFVAGIRPSVEGLISSGLRSFGFCVGTLGMLTALALRLATMAIRKAQTLSLRLANLERTLLDPPSRGERKTGKVS